MHFEDKDRFIYTFACFLLAFIRLQPINRQYNFTDKRNLFIIFPNFACPPNISSTPASRKATEHAQKNSEHMSDPTSTEIKSDNEPWSILENLILAQAIYKCGDTNWVAIARTIKLHPQIHRTSNFFTQKVRYTSSLSQVAISFVNAPSYCFANFISGYFAMR